MAALARSYLFAPGDNERLLGKVFDAGADAVVLDLEDAVAPDRKLLARRLIGDVLSVRNRDCEAAELAGEQLTANGAPLLHSAVAVPAIYVRINAVSTNFWQQDIAVIVNPVLRGVRLAKAESVAEIRALDAALAAAEAKAGIAAGTLKITATIESAAGVMAAFEMAREPRVEALAFGATDFIRDIGADPDELESQTLYARSHLVLASRAAGINPPIASVHTRIKDLEGLRATTEAARRLGFFGRSCIHPSQVPVINEVFTPTAEQVAEARAIIAAFDQAGAAALAMESGQFVDQPVAQRARAVVALAESLARFESQPIGH